jgi:hypothetical protein
VRQSQIEPWSTPPSDRHIACNRLNEDRRRTTTMSPKRTTAPPTRASSRSSSSGQKGLIAKENTKQQSAKKRTVLDNHLHRTRASSRSSSSGQKGLIAKENTKQQSAKKRTVLDNHLHRTDLTLSCAAKAHVATPQRHAGCREQARRRNTRSATCMTPSRFCSAEALQRRAEAGPHQLQREVSVDYSREVSVKTKRARSSACIL